MITYFCLYNINFSLFLQLICNEKLLNRKITLHFVFMWLKVQVQEKLCLKNGINKQHNWRSYADHTPVLIVTWSRFPAPSRTLFYSVPDFGTGKNQYRFAYTPAENRYQFSGTGLQVTGFWCVCHWHQTRRRRIISEISFTFSIQFDCLVCLLFCELIKLLISS